jgi:hypothetical protein
VSDETPNDDLTELFEITVAEGGKLGDTIPVGDQGFAVSTQTVRQEKWRIFTEQSPPLCELPQWLDQANPRGTLQSTSNNQ